MELPVPAGSSTPRRDQALRRGLALVGGNALLPGSAQLRAGSRWLGKLSLAVWGVTLLLAAAAVVVFMLEQNLVLGLFASGWFLSALGAFIVAVGIGWTLLILDALRLARLGDQTLGGRFALAGFTLVCVAAVVVATLGLGSIARSTARLSDAVFGGGGQTQTFAGRYNILLLGADDGEGRSGARIDSLNVVSVDAATGKAVMIGIPRNLQGVPFPEGSPLREAYPDGFRCAHGECMISAINQTVEDQYADRYPSFARPGIQATKEAVEELTGLPINYWVIVDLAGFQRLIDSVGGIRIALDREVPIWWDASGTEVTYAIGPGRDLHLDGEKTLWFVRARSDSNDYVRMSRQRCVMSAMLQQLEPATVLARFSDIAAAGEDVVATDAPASEAGRLAKVALKVRDTPHDSLPLTPPLVDPGDLDVALVRRLVAAAVGTTTPASASPTGSPTPIPPPSTSVAPTADPTPTPEPVEVAENCRPA